MLRVLINAVPIAPGGGLSVLLGLLGGLRDIGADLHITVLCGKRPTLEALRQRRLVDALKPVLLDARPTRQFMWQWRKLGPFVAQFRPDVLLSTNYYIGRVPCPQVVHHQNLYTLAYRRLVTYARQFPLKVLPQVLSARQALARAEANVFISGFLRRKAQAACPPSASRNYVVYNGLSPKYLAVAHEPIPQPQGQQLCAVQSSLPHKDNDVLIDAFAQICRTRPDADWRLSIAGPGDWRPWQEYARRQGVGQRVSFPGYLGEAELMMLFKRSRCLLFTSRMEAFGLPIIEAMACGCPVVAAPVTAMPEIGGNAFLRADVGSADAFARAAMSVVQEPELALRLAGDGKRRARRFQWARSAKRLMRILRAAAGDTSTSRCDANRGG